MKNQSHGATQGPTQGPTQGDPNYDALTDRLVACEDKLIRMFPPREVWVYWKHSDLRSVSADIELFGIGRVGGRMRLCWGMAYARDEIQPEALPNTAKPVTDCPLLTRVAVCDYLEKIECEIGRSKDQIMPSVLRAIQKMEQYCSGDRPGKEVNHGKD